MTKVVIATPTVKKPYPEYIKALEESIPALDAAGIEHSYVTEIGNPYISAARSIMLRKALDIQPDCIVFIDHDLSWRPGDLVRLIKTDEPVVCGTYRFKVPDEEKYMATLFVRDNGKPIVRDDGLIKADRVPAGFLKVTTDAVNQFMTHYPELCYGPKYRTSVDLFNHGAHNGIWWGEDYAFSRRWHEMKQDIWLIPDLELTHWGDNGTPYTGNYHEFLLRQPGGSKHVHAGTPGTRTDAGLRPAGSGKKSQVRMGSGGRKTHTRAKARA